LWSFQVVTLSRQFPGFGMTRSNFRGTCVVKADRTKETRAAQIRRSNEYFLPTTSAMVAFRRYVTAAATRCSSLLIPADL
jgi:hypothetical protein